MPVNMNLSGNSACYVMQKELSFQNSKSDIHSLYYLYEVLLIGLVFSSGKIF